MPELAVHELARLKLLHWVVLCLSLASSVHLVIILIIRPITYIKQNNQALICTGHYSINLKKKYVLIFNTLILLSTLQLQYIILEHKLLLMC